MEEKPRSVSVNALWYGLIAGAGMIVYSLILFLLDQHTNRYLGLLGLLVLAGVMVWGTIDYRNKYLGGYMAYGKAFVSCFLIGLVATIISIVYFYFFVTLIHPGFLNEMTDLTREQLINQYPDWSDEQIEQMMNSQSFMMKPAVMTIFGLIQYLIISAVMALIAAIFIKKEDKSLNTST